MHLYSGDYAVHFVNIDQPEDRVTICINAHAADNGDKAPGKCASYATKSAMLKMFSLETGENEESRIAPPPEPKPKQKITDARLEAAIKKILEGEYTREALNTHFELTSEQIAHVNSAFPEEGQE